MDTVAPPDATERSGRLRRRHRRALRWSAAGLATAILLSALVLVGAPLLPRPKVARGGWFLYRCEAVGGDIPTGFRGSVRLAPDRLMPSLTSVADGDTVYIAGRVMDPQGTDLGTGVWTASNRYPDPFPPFRAANDVARTVAANPGGQAADPSSGAIDAAVSCATR